MDDTCDAQLQWYFTVTVSVSFVCILRLAPQCCSIRLGYVAGMLQSPYGCDICFKPIIQNVPSVIEQKNFTKT